MRTIRRHTTALMVCILVAGAGHGGSARAEGLEQWLESEVIPHLEARFGRHPRLMGEPFEVRAVDDGRVVARMDGLSAHLLERIEDALQAVPDANLVHPAPVDPWTSTRRLSDLRCRDSNSARVRLIVEVEPGPESESARVAIQARDLREKAWIRGVEKIWQGALTRSQQKRLQAQRVDRSLLGSRELPYTEDQPDLLGARLAANVGCVLRRRSHQDRVVYLAPTGVGSSSGFFINVSVLLGRYLSTLRGIRLADEPDDAPVRLTLQVHRLDDDRYQVWTSIGEGESAGFVEPSAVTYVALADPTRTDGAAESPADTATGGLIETFELITPADRRLCDAPRPWAEGSTALDAHSRLSHGDCFAIRFGVSRPARLYLFAQTGNLEVRRLLPNDCNALHLGGGASRLQPGETLHVPAFRDGSAGYFRLDRNAGVEHVYALAVRGRPDHEGLRALVQQAADPCSLGQRSSPLEGKPFGTRLQRLAREIGTDAESALRSLVHVGDR